MASGVAILEEVVNTYNDLKLKHKYKYVVFKLSDDKTEIVVDRTEEQGKGKAEAEVWPDFLATLPAVEPRYVFYDFRCTQTREGAGESTSEKVIFINWCPDDALTKLKMVSASSKDALKKKLDAGIKEVQANDLSDLEIDDVKLIVLKK